MIHGRPYHPESQGQVENLNKRVKKKLAKLLCQRPADEQAKLWPYLLPLVVKEINTTWHHTIQDVPFRVFKGRSTAEFSYPVEEEFFEEGSDEDDGEFGDDDALSECEAYSRLSDLSSDNVHQTVEDGLEDQVRSFADRLEIGCNLARIREKTRLQALEATERMIATNTRHRFRVLEERIREFSVEEVVIFKDPETVPAKTKKDAKDPFKARNVLGIIKEKRALNFYRVQWEKNGKQQLSTLYAGMLTKFLGENKTREEKNPLTSAISHKDVADEVTSFAYSFRLKHKIIRQKETQELEEIEKSIKELWLALDFGVAASMLSTQETNRDVVTKYQNQYESGILSLTKRNFKFFLIGSVLWEKDRVRCPDQIFQYLDNSGTVLSKLHEGDCATCLAADPCNHPCYHNWFLEIGHRMGILKDEDICNDGNGKGKESEIPQESIFQYSPADQIDDACYPLLYGKHKSK